MYAESLDSSHAPYKRLERIVLVKLCCAACLRNDLWGLVFLADNVLYLIEKVSNEHINRRQCEDYNYASGDCPFDMVEFYRWASYPFLDKVLRLLASSALGRTHTPQSSTAVQAPNSSLPSSLRRPITMAKRRRAEWSYVPRVEVALLPASSSSRNGKEVVRGVIDLSSVLL